MMLVARNRKARWKTNLRKKGGKRELQKITIESKITTGSRKKNDSDSKNNENA